LRLFLNVSSDAPVSLFLLQQYPWGCQQRHGNSRAPTLRSFFALECMAAGSISPSALHVQGGAFLGRDIEAEDSLLGEIKRRFGGGVIAKELMSK